jgi:hypothetical protein
MKLRGQGGEEAAMARKLSAAQRAALSHPLLNPHSRPHRACVRQLAWNCSEILTCDIDEETLRVFGGPVWHACVHSPVRRRAKALLSGVGMGVLVERPGLRFDIYHFRRRMTREEIERLEVSVQ